MRPFTQHSGIAAPFFRDDINTDEITPTHRAVNTPRGKLGAVAFEPLRYDAAGVPDPEFPLNQRRYHGASILVTGRNFGCGSSRETAVWAIEEMGFRVVIAESYGEIFFRNCCKNGLLPVSLDRSAIMALADKLEAAETPQVSVDLEQQTIVGPDDVTFEFDLGATLRKAFLQGLDEIQKTLLGRDEIERFIVADRLKRPWIYSGLKQPGMKVEQG